jgi:hypothetical protein
LFQIGRVLAHVPSGRYLHMFQILGVLAYVPGEGVLAFVSGRRNDGIFSR